MIIDLQRFVTEEKPYWLELESYFSKFDKNSEYKMSVEELKRFYYLYQRVSSDLGKISNLSSEVELKSYLETIVAKAYNIVYKEKRQTRRFNIFKWFFVGFPQAFRRQYKSFLASLAITIIGFLFGGLSLWLNPDSKSVLMPFSHLQGSPSERVAKEEIVVEGESENKMAGVKGRFSAQLMTHNTRVSIFTFVLGVSWGIGTLILLFYNGVILGAVVFDYILAGETTFLMGWLLPHGAVEIPSIIIAGQAGFVIASALIGHGNRLPVKKRLRLISNDLASLISGVAILLVWAGIIESFLSQYHEPVIPYSGKIAFGVIELIALTFFLIYSGKKSHDTI